MRQLLVAANIVSSSLILVTPMMEELHSFETLVLTRATWHNIPEDGILLSYRRENLRSYERKLFHPNSFIVTARYNIHLSSM
jgi:hypothetical protein